MLILPIKRKWFDMIKSSEKKEEYREIKPYYNKRLGYLATGTGEIVTILFRNGYRHNSPAIKCKCVITVGKGKTEWESNTNRFGEKTEYKRYYLVDIIAENMEHITQY